VSLEPNRLADVWTDIARVAEALDVPDRGKSLIAELQARLDSIAERAAELPSRPRVACIEWTDPPMAAGNWVPELVAMAGGQNLFGAAGRHSPWLRWEELLEADPEDPRDHAMRLRPGTDPRGIAAPRGQTRMGRAAGGPLGEGPT
jgi:iron complex transport system substrate-binding protein